MLFATARFRRLGGDVPPPPDEIVARLLADPVFEPLGTAAVSRLADRVETVRGVPGTVVITEGEDGDRYFLIVSGTVEVTIQSSRRADDVARPVVRRDRPASERAAGGDRDVLERCRVARNRSRRLPRDGHRTPAQPGDRVANRQRSRAGLNVARRRTPVVGQNPGMVDRRLILDRRASDRGGDGEIRAAIDLGTNSFHLVVAQGRAGWPFRRARP